MLKDLILANPIISLILMIISTITGVWKVVHALYVKPRDFRINTMEKDIDTLRNEILKIEKKQTAENSSNNFQNDEPKITKVKEAEIELTHSISQQVPQENNTSHELVLNDLQALLDSWNSKELTDLQKKHFEEMYTNQPVTWEVAIKSVGEIKDGKIYVSIISPTAEFQLDRAIAYFDESFKEALLLMKKGEVAIITGVIERFFLSPIIKDCRLVRK
jgi:hypothetical protein